MEVIKFNTDNLDYFNSLFNKVEDLETILESLPVADRYISGNGSMLCSYYDKPDMPTWNDYRVLKAFEDAGIIKNRESLRSFYSIDTCWATYISNGVNDENKDNLLTAKKSNNFIQGLDSSQYTLVYDLVYIADNVNYLEIVDKYNKLKSELSKVKYLILLNNDNELQDLLFVKLLLLNKEITNTKKQIDEYEDATDF